jgi:hypothetical protein
MWKKALTSRVLWSMRSDMAHTGHYQGRTELAFRENHGISVSLVWDSVRDTVAVILVDSNGGEKFELDATGENVLDVFYHPYAYAAFRGVEYGAAVPSA